MKSLKVRIQEWRQSISSAKLVSENTEQVNQLSQMLLGPLYEQGQLKTKCYRHLVIVGDDILRELPFAALKTPKGTRLVEEIAISSPFSLTMLTWPYPYRATSKSTLVVSNPADNPGIGTRTARQSPMIKALFTDISPFDEVSATKANMTKRIGDSQIVHFDLSYEANNLNGLFSYLMLNGQKDPDRNLTLVEVIGTPLKAQLAVLSDCHTMPGGDHDGEGLLGLEWALNVSGCPALAAPLWEVNDMAAVMLLNYFYRELLSGKTQKQGLSKDEALRKAMLAVLKKPEYSAPHNWAAFQIMGTTTPLRMNMSAVDHRSKASL